MSANAQDVAVQARIQAPVPDNREYLLSADCLALLGRLARAYRPRVDRLLERRAERQTELDEGRAPDFPPASQDIRDSDWKVDPIPEDLTDRRVEITGPVDRKMIINALNSGARVFMADFEDSSTPTWENMVEGQANLYEAVRRTIEFTGGNGKEYSLGDNPAVLKVRPRGWHLDEKHVSVDGRPVPAGVFDAVVYLYHNAGELIRRDTGPYLYLPKLESYGEALVWQDLLTDIEKALGLAPGAIKVTVLIETIMAVFQMDEILHALRNRVVGLNCGRWDYIFSYIKRFRTHSDKVLPDREQVTMTVPFLHAYSKLLIRTCHHRGAFAMGGMAAQIPIRDDPAANEQALAKVRADKEREAGDGHDGTWVAHPGLIPMAMEIFDRHLGGPNQLDVLREDVRVSSADLLAPCTGTITEAGVRGNLRVAMQYLTAWLDGQGCVPIHHLMEDAATAEIARAQLWQWARHPAGRLEDGTDIDLSLIGRLHDEELATLREAPHGPNLDAAAELLRQVTADDDFVEFITLPAYARLA